MAKIYARKIIISGNRLHISTRFRQFSLIKSDIAAIKVLRIPSFFEEIAIELYGHRRFIITERVDGFLDLAKFLHIEEIFGPWWYRDAENGQEFEHILQ